MPRFVTSFIPGRIRLRARIFRDSKLTAALIPVLEGTGAVTSVEVNNETGSVLLKYKPEALPPDETLKARFIEFAKTLPDAERLGIEIAFYRPEYRADLLKALEKLQEALPAILAR